MSSTGEYIPENASHWRIEPFIPVPAADLTAYLVARLPQSIRRAEFSQICDRLAIQMYLRTVTVREQLDRAYARLDPDRDTSLLVQRTAADGEHDAAEVTEWMRQTLAAADYTELTRECLQAATQISSLWGVPLSVDLEIFRHLAVFARGDVMGIREHRSWWRLYRKQLVDVPIYRRLVVLYQVRPGIPLDGEGEPDRLYLRMFKNIPKADVDMLVPGSQIRIGWIDRTKILVPSLGGIGMSLWKLVRLVLVVAVLTTSKLLVLVGLLGATVGYVIRSVTSYLQTKKNYELNLTRNLYFQKLDSNAGVIYRVLEEARQQDYREAVLAYYALLSGRGAVSRRRLRRHAERILREALDVEVGFEVDDALATLRELGLAAQQEDGNWVPVDCATALKQSSDVPSA